jgi:putative PIN family toxin of toxin-antitoxin system
LGERRRIFLADLEGRPRLGIEADHPLIREVLGCTPEVGRARHEHDLALVAPDRQGVDLFLGDGIRGQGRNYSPVDKLASHIVLRLVLDTQVWLDWLVFNDPGVLSLRDAVERGQAHIYMDAACDAELERVLAYDLGRHSIGPAAQGAALAHARRLSRRIENTLTAAERAGLPRCRDADDQIFLEAALAAGADVLVTKDRALLELGRRRTRPLPFRVASPEEKGVRAIFL